MQAQPDPLRAVHPNGRGTTKHNKLHINNAANGMLSITARCPSGECGVRDGSITSGRINTKDKFELKYGKVQARIKVPDGKSTWPAFWMLGADFPETGWPKSGEIDIMEIHQLHSDINTANFSMHWQDDSSIADGNPLGKVSFTQSKTLEQSLSSGFHIYEMEWDDKRVVGKIDGVTYYTKTIDSATMSEFMRPFFMILNVAVDGNLGKEPDAIKTIPQEMLVDWIQVFQKPEQIAANGSSNDGADNTGNDGADNTNTDNVPADKVIALFSDPYTQINGVDYNPDWGQETVYTTEAQDTGNDVIKLSNLDFQGIDFSANQKNLSAMNALHVNFRTPDEITAASEFKIKLVDFGADKAFGGGDDSEHELVFGADSVPPLVKDSWISLDVPLSSFTRLTSKAAVSQLVFGGSDSLNTVYLDDIYFKGDGTADTTSGSDTGGSASPTSAPARAAATPTHNSADVVSIFSDAYTNISDIDYNPGWGQSTVMTGVDIENNATLRYVNLNFQGIDFGQNVQDLSAMKSLHLDVWTPDNPENGAQLKLKLVDFGVNGVFERGDDAEHEIVINANTAPKLTSGNWVGYDISLDDFSGLTSRKAVSQLVISGLSGLGTLFVDNVYFHN